jgi:hypothetical protein
MQCWSNPVFSAVRTTSIIGWLSCRPVTCFRTYVYVREDILGIAHFLIHILGHRHFKILTCLHHSSRLSVSIRFTEQPSVRCISLSYLCCMFRPCSCHWFYYHSNISRRKIMTVFSPTWRQIRQFFVQYTFA